MNTENDIKNPIPNLEYPILNECGFKRSLKSDTLKLVDIVEFTQGRPENVPIVNLPNLNIP